MELGRRASQDARRYIGMHWQSLTRTFPHGSVAPTVATCGCDPLCLVRGLRSDGTVTAIYGFSGGGYRARLIWKELSGAERARIRKVIVIGSPQITEADFTGSSDVLILTRSSRRTPGWPEGTP